MCRRFNSGPDHLRQTRVSPGFRGRKAGFFVLASLAARVGRCLRMTRMPAVSASSSASFPCVTVASCSTACGSPHCSLSSPSIAALTSTTDRWVYRSILRVIVDCRASCCATLGEPPWQPDWKCTGAGRRESRRPSRCHRRSPLLPLPRSARNIVANFLCHVSDQTGTRLASVSATPASGALITVLLTCRSVNSSGASRLFTEGGYLAAASRSAGECLAGGLRLETGGSRG
jgi:hypothetical protein